MVRIPGFHCQGPLGFHCHGPGSIHGWGTEILQAMRYGKKKKKKGERENKKPFTSQRQRPQKKPTLPTPTAQNSSPQNRERMNSVV